jgi:hypothetical protein
MHKKVIAKQACEYRLAHGLLMRVLISALLTDVPNLLNLSGLPLEHLSRLISVLFFF